MLPRTRFGRIGLALGRAAARGGAALGAQLLHRARHLRDDLRHAGAEPAAAGRLHGTGQPRPRRLLRARRLHRLSHHAGQRRPLDPDHSAGRRPGRGPRRLAGRLAVAAHQGLLLPDGDAGLRADGVLPVPRHQARRRHRRRLPAAARCCRCSGLGAAAQPAPAADGDLLRGARPAGRHVPRARPACCARCSGACWRASASTSTACRRWASTPIATSWRPS